MNKPNQFKALLGLIKSSLLSSLRSPSALFFNFFFPFIFISIFGMLGQSDMTFDIGLRSDSHQDNAFYESIKENDILKVQENFSNEELDEKLKKGQLAVVINIKQDGILEIPTENPDKPIQKIDKYHISIEKSAASPDSAQTISIIINEMIRQFNNQLNPESNNMLTKSTKTVSGRKFEQIDFILPGQLAFALLTNALFGISFTFLTMRKQLIIKRLFSTPVRKWVILASEGLTRVIIAVLQSLLIILVGHFIFDFTLTNGAITVLEMLVLSVIGVIVFIGFGFLVASIAKTEEAVSPISNLIMMPQLFLSGAFFPIEVFPKYIQVVAEVLPMTFLNKAFQKVAFEGAHLGSTANYIGGLLIWGIILYIIVIQLFRWE